MSEKKQEKNETKEKKPKKPPINVIITAWFIVVVLSSVVGFIWYLMLSLSLSTAVDAIKSKAYASLIVIPIYIFIVGVFGYIYYQTVKKLSPILFPYTLTSSPP